MSKAKIENIIAIVFSLGLKINAWIETLPSNLNRRPPITRNNKWTGQSP